ncbi:flavin reductase family protein (plasmid) [Rhodococcus sp. USK10]|uniref:flavin reductase family protein n=1 Tax=Rhodococcus sp. USK10 TaxID=2789739 RepID=UPI001C5E08BA|nr:flavin reductase family protein [Rhodococcus sp. USK10]QYA99777.1 flavin reductase family protein [Rhodococcus sp. USK10]
MKSMESHETPMAFSASVLRKSFGHVPSGVVALCALVDEEPVGTVLSTFIPVSLDPPLVAVSLQNGSRSWNTLRDRPRLGVTILSESQGIIARSLATPGPDRFKDLDYAAFDSDAIRIGGGVGYFECALRSEHQAGDHVLAVMDVHSVDVVAPRLPLVFHCSDFVTIGDKQTAA